jgi:putative SOS response-associated peptidase YedK
MGANLRAGAHYSRMCGRYGLSAPQRTAELSLDASLLADVAASTPRWNITPSQTVYAVVGDADGVRPARLRWGLVPFWAKEPSIGNRLANARGESVRSKPAFRRAFASRRALVLADLYYEWQALEGARVKQPWCIRAPADRPFALAALWESWQPPVHADGRVDDPIETCTLITTSANTLTSAIHDRMPVIIPEHEYGAWLNVATPLDVVESLLAPIADDALYAFRVSTWVNNPAHDDARCIEPLADATEIRLDL